MVNVLPAFFELPRLENWLCLLCCGLGQDPYSPNASLITEKTWTPPAASKNSGRAAFTGQRNCLGRSEPQFLRLNALETGVRHLTAAPKSPKVLVIGYRFVIIS